MGNPNVPSSPETGGVIGGIFAAAGQGLGGFIESFFGALGSLFGG